MPKEFQLPFHQQPRSAGRSAAGEHPRHAFGRSMSTVRGTKGVIHVNICQGGELLSKWEIILLLLFMKTQVFQEQHVPRLQNADGLFRFLADTILQKAEKTLTVL